MTPDNNTNQEFLLPVSDGYELYVQDWGNKNAKKPILFLHGGPGYGVKDSHKMRFNPNTQRVIFFDQRGSGKSMPSGSIENNTTQHTIKDMLTIINHLDLKNIILTGSSWGATLALLFALEHPEYVNALAISGIYTARKKEVEYLGKGGYKLHYPDVWDDVLKNTPSDHHDDPSKYHFPRVLSDNTTASKESAAVYINAAIATMSLDDRHLKVDAQNFDHKEVKVEIHYLQNLGFIPEGYILNNAHKITIPVWIIQGRYDFNCPPETAHELSKILPNCNIMFAQSGHGSDRSTYDMMRTVLLQLSQSND